jgi:DNA polymerase III subunit beta
MIINLLQNKLKEGLNIIGRATSRSTTLPVLKNIIIKTEDDFINLSSTDLEMAIKLWTLGKIEEEGDVTIPYSSFSSFVNLLPNEKITLKTEDNNIFLNCNDYKTQINGINSDEFPIIPETEEKHKITINSNILCEGLVRIIDIPSLSKVKPEISGVLFSFKENKLNLVATDSYRLAEKKIKIKNSNNDEFSFIIPQRTTKEVVNIFKETNKDIDIIFGENQILFRSKMDDFDHSHIEVTSKIIEGNYPDYKKIIPTELKTKITLNKDEFLNKIKASSVFTSKINEVVMEINSEKEEVVIKSNNTDLGNYETKIKGKTEGEDVSVSFNYRFLLDGLSNIKSSEIIFEINNESSPGVLKPVGSDDYIYVVMPIKN